MKIPNSKFTSFLRILLRNPSNLKSSKKSFTLRSILFFCNENTLPWLSKTQNIPGKVLDGWCYYHYLNESISTLKSFSIDLQDLFDSNKIPIMITQMKDIMLVF